MSSQTNIAINSRSMNGIITISDGGGTTIENGEITTNNLTAPNVATLNENETITGVWTYSVLPQSSVVPTLGAQLVNKTYTDLLDSNNVKISGSQTLTTGVKTFTNLPQSTATPTLGAELVNKTFVDGLDAQNIKISGSQTLTTGVKTFTNLPQSTAVPSNNADFVNKLYADGTTSNMVTLNTSQTLTTGVKTFTNLPQSTATPTLGAELVNKTFVDTLDANNVKLTGNQSIGGLKTFTTLPQSSVVPTLGAELVNKTFVDTLDANNVKLLGNQSVGGLKTFTSLVRINESSTNAYMYLGSGTNELGIYQNSGYSYLQSKAEINFFTNSTNLGSASRVVIGDAGLLINTNGKLFLDNALTTFINKTTNLMNFYAPTSSQFKWLINSVQCAILDAGAFVLTGGLRVGTGELLELNNAGSNIWSATADMIYQVVGVSANHYFNIGGTTTCGVNTTGFKIEDTKVLQLGSVNTTNIQKNGTIRLDYNVPTGMTHSQRVNGLEILSIATGGIRIPTGNSMYFNTITDPVNAINASGTTLKLYANNTQSVSIIPEGIKVNVRPYQLYLTGTGGNGVTAPSGRVGAMPTQATGFNVITAYGGAVIGSWNVASAEFTAPTDGLYQIELNIFNNGVNTTGRTLSFLSPGVIGGQQYCFFNESAVGGECAFQWTITLWLTTGYTCYFQNQSGVNNTYYYAYGHTTLSIIRLY